MRYAELLDNKDPSEIDTLTFDFADMLNSGETVSTVVMSVSDLEKVDGTPSTFLSGSASITSPFVTQTITGGVEGAMYLVKCLATLSTGRKLMLAARVPVRALK